MSRHALLDADVLVYWSAFGAQKTRYVTVVETFDNNQAYEDYLKQLPQYILDCKDGAGKREAMLAAKARLPADKQVDILSEGAAIMLARKNLQSVCQQIEATSFELFISGADNFREKIATLRVYKGNRVAAKPAHYDAVRSWFVDSQGAHVSIGQEADDDIGIAATDNPHSVICTIDKDLMQIPGRHFNWNKGLRFRIDEDKGDLWFWLQMLVGDPSDNIPGIAGIGEVSANRMLAESTLSSRPQIVFAAYESQYGDTAMEAINEVGKLLWIRRKPHEMWDFNQHVERVTK